MQNKKRWLFMIGLLTLFFLVACKHSNKTEEIKLTLTEERIQSGTLIIYIATERYPAKVWHHLISNYRKEYPDIKVELRSTDLFTNQQADVVILDENYNQQHSGAVYKNLDKFMNTIEIEFLPYLQQMIEAPCTRLPLLIETDGYWYNKFYMDSKGYKTQGDYDEITQFMNENLEDGVQILSYDSEDWESLFWSVIATTVYNQMGKEAYDSLCEGEASAFTGKAFRIGLEKLVKLTKDNKRSEKWISDWMSGNSIYINAGFWLPPNIQNKVSRNFDIQYAPFIINSKDDKNMGILLDCLSVAIPDQAKNEEAAFSFLEYLYRQEVLQKLVGDAQSLSVCQVNYDAKGVNKTETMKQVTKVLCDPDVALLYKDLNWSYNTYDVFEMAILQLMNGECNAEDVVDMMKAATE